MDLMNNYSEYVIKIAKLYFFHEIPNRMKVAIVPYTYYALYTHTNFSTSF